MIIFIIIFIVLFLVEIFYIKYASLKGIEDHSNNRNSHLISTVRGGGIIFLPALFLFFFFFYEQVDKVLGYFIIATIIIAVVSFIDDCKTTKPIIRIIFQFISATIVLFTFDIFDNGFVKVISSVFFTYILILGYSNIYNFMDGINGMTFLNSLCSYITLYLINTFLIHFTNSNLLLIFIISTVVFGYFNFRKRPKCFAGDVGSITIGFTILFFTLKLFVATKNPLVFLILGIYALDGGWTIIERLYRKENIFKSHLRHLYELYANQIKIPHLAIAAAYFILQLGLNAIVYYSIKINFNNIISFIILSVFLSLVYYFIKTKTYKKIK
ncbi:UDP-N-acetylmuramyl pentapeptide phosphotransferase/UDP-N-acetylglucosamine-1-phosphate transferase [Flaviramulus basaltis]|uniref:UDP-N-acetylmuramyl pentapeptide phosphotransferase/UDP-N-acetylglucosamine-1-phosphate transferase n=1 Tax=Flaviramulus basaltis TaxID=369401 RepID=A0A1K2ICY1_9FLAO|nr:hypothetical protein [Flaviramulus basaltis]SFZ90110.1 UDP-N-acetylmuramyl pentapeptide phosphotransferase/UDP-N-acetylglucosamine-1-phosphate transferase [Flaviramulus basaltis]